MTTPGTPTPIELTAVAANTTEPVRRWRRNVKQLRSGQKFIWVDRTVTLVRTGKVRRGKRPSRQLIVDVPGIGIRKLWYYEDEKVWMVDTDALPETPEDR